MTTGDTVGPQPGPVPHSSSATSEPFWQGCRGGVLRYQRCAECDEANFPPVQSCRFCQSDRLQWHDSGGVGEIYSWTVVHRAVTPEFRPPYAPAIVTLREGYQMLSNIVGVEPGLLRIGLPVRVEFHSLPDGLVLPYFTAGRHGYP